MRAGSSVRRRIALATMGLGGLALAGVGALYLNSLRRRPETQDADLSATLGLVYPPPLSWQPPRRVELLARLDGSAQAPYDVLVIGGGASGCGVAVDAASRGLSVCLVERDDYGAGTSSRSTKLVHGGVRYLENAFKKLDYGQYELVMEALHERATYLRNAPYVTSALPIMLPLYKWIDVPYYWAGTHVYSMISGREALGTSYFVPPSRALELFPMLNPQGLKGAMVYYDGQTNDSRMNIALAMTAVALGATCLNHMEVISLGRDASGKRVSGCTVKDTLTGKERFIHAKTVVNATGPFCDSLRKLDDPNAEPVVVGSAGTHIVLPNYYSPRNMGLIDPQTSDGRVIFFIPWAGKVVAGTTDVPCEVVANPTPTEKEISFILSEIKSYLSPEVHVRRGDVSSAWSGIRPLVRDPNSLRKDSKTMSRSHVVFESPSGLVTVCGGKWTTYRRMAEDTVDFLLQKNSNLISARGPCVTERLRVLGSHGWTPNSFVTYIQSFGIELPLAHHLSSNFGNQAELIVQLMKPTGKKWPVLGVQLEPGSLHTEAEVRFAVRNEHACTLVDVLARRLRLAFLDTTATLEVTARVADVMQEELGWSKLEKERQIEDLRAYLRTMESNEAIARSHFNSLEICALRDFYYAIDSDHDGLVTFPQLLMQLEKAEIPLEVVTLAEVFGKNKRLTFPLFLDIMRDERISSIAQRIVERKV